MEQKTSPVGMLIAIAAAAFLGWFAYNGYFNADPADQTRDPAAAQRPLPLN